MTRDITIWTDELPELAYTTYAGQLPSPFCDQPDWKALADWQRHAWRVAIDTVCKDIADRVRTQLSGAASTCSPSS